MKRAAESLIIDVFYNSFWHNCLQCKLYLWLTDTLRASKATVNLIGVLAGPCSSLGG
jgi:hypothetical protein